MAKTRWVAREFLSPSCGAMTHTVACIIIASAKRRDKVREIIVASALTQAPAFAEIVVVGDWPADPIEYPPGVRYLCVAPLLGTTTDALVKRDAGTVATTADTLVYVCDDHALGPHFARDLNVVLAEPWDVLVPNRYTEVTTFPSYVSPDGKTRSEDGGGWLRVPLNNGEAHAYCGGHAGVFRRALIARLPWTAGPHDRLWDVTMSRAQQALGATFRYYPRLGIAVRDLEPEQRPWE